MPIFTTSALLLLQRRLKPSGNGINGTPTQELLPGYPDAAFGALYPTFAVWDMQKPCLSQAPYQVSWMQHSERGTRDLLCMTCKSPGSGTEGMWRSFCSNGWSPTGPTYCGAHMVPLTLGGTLEHSQVQQSPARPVNTHTGHARATPDHLYHPCLGLLAWAQRGSHSCACTATSTVCAEILACIHDIQWRRHAVCIVPEYTAHSDIEVFAGSGMHMELRDLPPQEQCESAKYGGVALVALRLAYLDRSSAFLV